MQKLTDLWNYQIEISVLSCRAWYIPVTLNRIRAFSILPVLTKCISCYPNINALDVVPRNARI